jgi:hypothetical protein
MRRITSILIGFLTIFFSTTSNGQQGASIDETTFKAYYYPKKGHLPETVAGIPLGISMQDFSETPAYCPGGRWSEKLQQAFCYSEPVYVPYTQSSSGKLPVLVLQFSLFRLTRITLVVPNRKSVELLADALTKKYGAPSNYDCDENNDCSWYDWKGLALLWLFKEHAGSVVPDQQWWDAQGRFYRKFFSKAPFWTSGKGGYYWDLAEGSITLSSSDGKLYTLTYNLTPSNSY